MKQTASVDNDPRLADFDSPLKIRHLIAAFTRTGEIPEDLVHEYIQFLLEREAEKMDPNVIYVETYLQVLGYIVETRPDGAEIEDGLRSADAERIFGRLKDYRGWAAQDSRGILMLTLDMGLLITAETDSGARLMFASDSYSYYFYLDAVDTGSDADAQAIMADLWGYHDRSGTTDS